MGAARCLAALAACVTMAGCLGSDSNAPPAAGGGAAIAIPVALTDCSDWNSAGPAQRTAIIGSVAAVSGGRTGSPAGRGRTLPEDKAYNLFDVSCRPDYSKRFRLYKLYERAAAFQGR